MKILTFIAIAMSIAAAILGFDYLANQEAWTVIMANNLQTGDEQLAKDIIALARWMAFLGAVLAIGIGGIISYFLLYRSKDTVAVNRHEYLRFSEYQTYVLEQAIWNDKVNANHDLRYRVDSPPQPSSPNRSN